MNLWFSPLLTAKAFRTVNDPERSELPDTGVFTPRGFLGFHPTTLMDPVYTGFSLRQFAMAQLIL